MRQWVYAWLASAAFAFALELSAIERTVDLVTKEHHDLAGRAKDAASAFVGLTAISVGIAWGVILFG